MRLTHNIFLFAASSFLFSGGNSKPCPPLGRVLPAPQSAGESQAVKDAVDQLKASLGSTFKATLQNSGVSIGVKSIHETKPLFNHHFTPPNLSGIGTDAIDEHTIFRVGSVSKMMPALAVLQNSSINLDDSVLKYLPGLKNGRNTSDTIHAIDWEEVTIRSLAAHLSGLGTDMAFDLAIFPNGPWAKMGLPEVSGNDAPDCSGLPGTRPCTSKDIIDHLNRRPPVYQPYTSPVYSNIGFALLGMVVEAATGKKFEDVVKSGIFEVAGMNSTSFNGPVSEFSHDGAGGMFSNTIDMLAFSEAILKHKFLSPANTRKWMEPITHTSSLGYSVGAPWEILRSDNLTEDGRVIDVYTKSGDLGLYHALIGMVPDYDVVVTVLTGGAEVTLESDARSELFSTVVQALIPAIDKAAREEAAHNGFVGKFADAATNSTLQLSMDHGSGLVIDAFVVRGFDVLHHFTDYSLGNIESNMSAPGNMNIKGRLYPADITSRKEKGKETGKSRKCSAESVWRAAFETLTDEQKAEQDGKLFYVDGSCESWFGLDRSVYNYLSLAEFIFQSGTNGRVKRVRNAAFDVSLVRVD